jgi:UDP-glucose 4-epimerase
MKIVIVGAGGFIGRHLSHALSQVEEIESLILVERSPSPHCTGLATRYSKVQAIVSEHLDQLPDSLFTPRTIFVDLSSNLGPRSYSQFSLSAALQNTEDKFPFYRRIANADGSHIFYTSSGGTVYSPEGAPQKTEDMAVRASSVYSFCKLSDENLITSLFGKGSAFTILRLSNPYGPGQVFKNLQGVAPVLINCLMTGAPFKVIGSLNDIRDYIFIDDLIDAMVTLLSSHKGHQNTIYNVGSGTACSLGCFIDTMQVITQRKVNLLGEGATSIHGHYLSIDKITKATGWRPTTDLKDGLTRWLSLEFPELLGRQAISNQA